MKNDIKLMDNGKIQLSKSIDKFVRDSGFGTIATSNGNCTGSNPSCTNSLDCSGSSNSNCTNQRTCYLF